MFQLNPEGWNELKRSLGRSLETIAKSGVEQGKNRVHVITGRLRDSIRTTQLVDLSTAISISIVAGGIVIRNRNVDYAAIEEARHPNIVRGVIEGIQEKLSK